MQTRQLKMVFEVTDRHTKYACHFALVRVMVVLAVVGAVINWPFVVVQYGVHALQGGDFLAYTKKSVWKFQKNYKKSPSESSILLLFSTAGNRFSSNSQSTSE